MTTLRTAKSLRRLSRTPTARALAVAANALRSATLHALVDKVQVLEADALIHGERCLTRTNVNSDISPLSLSIEAESKSSFLKGLAGHASHD